jgi:hypothetical protein
VKKYEDNNLLSLFLFFFEVEDGAEWVSGSELRCCDRGFHFSFLLKEM